MPAKREQWITISLKPLTGILDVRSRPADLPAGSFRWKQNIGTTDEGKICRRDGFSRAFTDLLFGADSNIYHNADHHRQGAGREPITFLFESTAPDGTRRLYDGTESRLSVLDESTAYWTDLTLTPAATGGFGAYWRAAQLQDTIVFIDGNAGDEIYSHVLGSGVANRIPELYNVYVPGAAGPPVVEPTGGMNVHGAKVVVAFNGFMFLMNVNQDGAWHDTRVRWSDLNSPTSWLTGVTDSLAGFQDLDYGDEILAACPMMGSLYIFTRRSIWRCSVSTDPNASFSFTRVYNEPKNQTGCIAYPRTLVAVGSEVYYMSRDGIYRYSPYLAAPERDDWLHRASGVIFKRADTAMSGVMCNLPCAEYVPSKKEIWFSWPSTTNLVNNWTLVAMIGYQTADVVDHGFMSFVNYRRTPAITAICNEDQSFLAVSATDYAIKDIGGVFYREMLVMPDGDPTTDIQLDVTAGQYASVYETQGYYSILRGLIPTGFHDREKRLRNVLIDPDVSEQDHPCAMRVRIGNSYMLVDPNDEDNTCAPQWRQMPDKALSCPDGRTISSMTAANLKPSTALEWATFEQNRFLYYDITISQTDGTAAIGGDVCLQRIDFDLLALPKP